MADDPMDLKRIKHAIRTLPRRQRDIFLAIRFGGLDYDELAERTGLTAGQVEREFAKALVNCIRCLDKKP